MWTLRQANRHLPLLTYAHGARRSLICRKAGETATGDTDYEEAIKLLNRYQTRQRDSSRSKLSPRERTKLWLRHLGHDIDLVDVPKIIHVAGTKGKGTTCYYCNRILAEHQRRTGHPQKIGCLTSPHQTDVRERILINNQKIPKPLFSHYIRKLDTEIQLLARRAELETPSIPGYPGFLALLGIYVFLLEKVDVIILETGIGGERDSTNIFPRPVATGITTIGIDHVAVLGQTVEEIAWHKAGIFKSGSLAVTVIQDDAILKVLQIRSKEKGVAEKLKVITDCAVLEYGVKVNPDMPYQRLNAALAISLAETYLKSVDSNFSMTKEIACSLQDVELLGRSQIIEEGDNTWFLSSGVNAISLKETVSWFKAVERPRNTVSPQVLIFNQNINITSPRDPYQLLKVIHEALCTEIPIVLQGVIFCTDRLDASGTEKPDLTDFRVSREVTASLFAQRQNSRIWQDLGGSGEVMIVRTARDAVHLIKEKFRGAEVLVTGSGYLTGNILEILGSEV